MKYRVQDRQLKTKKGGLKEIRSPQSSVNKKVFQQKKEEKRGNAIQKITRNKLHSEAKGSKQIEKYTF